LRCPTELSSAPLAVALLGAARAIASVMGGRTLDATLAEQQVVGPIRAAIQDLAYGALRRFGRGDFLLSQLMHKPLRDNVVRGLLLAALYRLVARPEDAHTTVDQAVSAAAALDRGKYRALVNAVLRSALRQSEPLAVAVQADLTANWQHPLWWLEKLRINYPDDWREIAEAGNGHPPMTLRVNRRRTDTAIYLDELAAAGIQGRSLGGDAIQLAKPYPIERIPGFAEGSVSVQDWGAQQAAGLLDAKDGMRVLDACAAPGGKTGHLLELADLDLTALDISADRTQRIVANLARLGLSATVKTADSRRPESWWEGRSFDRVLADAPCSASGVVGRHPDIKWLRRPDDIAGFARGQREILGALWQVLAPGGKMLYASCSLFPEENGELINAFVASHADATRLPVADNKNEWQLTPTLDHDGFYYALLEKHA
jgi:16S rRNA (cytosine967-C5)-methyltransferase